MLRVIDNEMKGIYLNTTVLVNVLGCVSARVKIGLTIPCITFTSFHVNGGMLWVENGKMQGDDGVATVDSVECLAVITRLGVSAVIPCV